MREKFTLSIRSIIQFMPITLTAVALTLATLLLLGYIAFIQRDVLNMLLRERSKFICRDLSRTTTHVHEQMTYLASEIDPLLMPPAMLQEMMQQIMRYESFYTEVALLDANGRVLLAHAEDSRYQPGDLLPDFSPVSQATWLLSVNGTPAQAMVLMPVPPEAERATTYLLALGDLDFLRQSLSSVPLGNTGYGYLLAPESGTLIFVQDDTLQVVNDLSAYPQVRALLTGEAQPLRTIYRVLGLPIYAGLQNKMVLRQETAVDHFPWLLFIELPTDEAYKFFYQISGFLVALFVLELAVATGIGIFFARRIVAPLRQLVIAATQVSAGNLQTTVSIESPRELQILGQVFNHMTSELRELVESLEQRVAHRTAIIRRRSAQIEAAAQTARDATTAYELDELLKRAVNLVPSRFGFYHAGIFLIDEQGEYAVLRAATGEVGEQMLAQQHRLKVGEEGIVGYVTQTGLPYIASDTRQDPVYWANPLLPDTRSEMGLPLKVGERIIGVMNVQSKELGAFEAEDITILQILTDQLAVAIEKTRLFAQTQARLEEQLKTIVSNLPVILFSFNQEGVVTAAAGQGLVTLGVAHVNFVGRQLTEILSRRPEILQDVQHALQGTAVSNTYNIGGLVWETRYLPLLSKSGEVTRVIGVANDISERMRAESSLREKEMQLRQIIDAVPQMVIAKSSDGRILLANQAVADAYQTRVQNLIGTFQAQWHTQPQELAQFLQHDQEVLRTNRPVVIAEERFTTASGTERFLQTTKLPFAWNKGKETAVLSISVDITERKQTEAILRHTQKLESLGVLAGGVAHDFNNLLVAILGQISLAQARLSPEHPAYKATAKATRAAERAADLTRQLLAYSGHGHFEIQPLNLNRLIEENLHFFEVSVPKNVQLRAELAPDLPLVEADAGQMQQVIMNLILNGADALGNKPGAVTVTTAVQTLQETTFKGWQFTGEALAPGTYVVLEVHDNGRGMDKETVQRIFDPFFTTKHTGRGLGLAVVLGIVRGHRGGIRVYSEPGKGTIFRVLLPVTNQQVYQALPETAVAPHAKPAAHILVVDDEQPVRETIADMLELAGYTVSLAASGHAAIDLYRAHAEVIDLVLLDLSMPDMNGEETFRVLRAINPAVLVLLSSGYNEVEATRRFVGQRLAGFLQKPFSAEMLLAKIEELLRQQYKP